MPEIPFEIQCTIPENRLNPYKDCLHKEYLCSELLSNIPHFEYFMRIFPNGNTKERQGQTWLVLHLKLKNVKNFVAKWNLSIESANYSVSDDEISEENNDWEISVCAYVDFFDPEKNFIVDEECTVKVNGIFKFENLFMTEINGQQKWSGSKLGDNLWKNDNTKDFTIVVDGKVIKVHKFVLGARSSVFSAMLNSKVIQSIEIPDFSFDVVETAVKLIYDCNFTFYLSLNDQKSLLKFLDKYDLPTLMDQIELPLIKQLSAPLVCRLTSYYIFRGSKN